jgi:hypothetical protein
MQRPSVIDHFTVAQFNRSGGGLPHIDLEQAQSTTLSIFTSLLCRRSGAAEDARACLRQSTILSTNDPTEWNVRFS